MTAYNRASRILPAALAVGFLATALAAAVLAGPGLAPNASAATNCPYSKCTDSQPVSLTTIEAIIGLLALVAIVLGVLIWRDRRRPPRAAPSEWTDATPAGGPAAASAAYTEGPEDISVTPPELPAGAAPAAGQEGDIDSLMAELDRISGEILKPGVKGKKGGSGGTEPSDGSGGSD